MFPVWILLSIFVLERICKGINLHWWIWIWFEPIALLRSCRPLLVLWKSIVSSFVQVQVTPSLIKNCMRLCMSLVVFLCADGFHVGLRCFLLCTLFWSLSGTGSRVSFLLDLLCFAADSIWDLYSSSMVLEPNFFGMDLLLLFAVVPIPQANVTYAVMLANWRI